MSSPSPLRLDDPDIIKNLRVHTKNSNTEVERVKRLNAKRIIDAVFQAICDASSKGLDEYETHNNPWTDDERDCIVAYYKERGFWVRQVDSHDPKGFDPSTWRIKFCWADFSTTRKNDTSGDHLCD